MRITDDNLDNGLDLNVILVFIFYFIFSFIYVYWISRGLGTVDQCSCRRADDKRSYSFNLKEENRGCESNRHIAVVILESDNKC